MAEELAILFLGHIHSTTVSYSKTGICTLQDNHIQLDPSCEHPDHEAEDPAPSCTNHKNRKGLVTAEDHVISQSITNVNEGGADENMQNQASACRCKGYSENFIRVLKYS